MYTADNLTHISRNLTEVWHFTTNYITQCRSFVGATKRVLRGVLIPLLFCENPTSHFLFILLSHLDLDVPNFGKSCFHKETPEIVQIKIISIKTRYLDITLTARCFLTAWLVCLRLHLFCIAIIVLSSVKTDQLDWFLLLKTEFSKYMYNYSICTK